MRCRAIRLLAVLLIAAGGLTAADDPSANAFRKAMATQDATAKKEAIRGLAGKDDDVLPLLVQAVGDRQAHDAAVEALRARTGLLPSNKKGGGYPGYPNKDTVSDWSRWLEERKKDKETQLKLAEQEKKLKSLEETVKKDEEEAAKDGKDAADGKDGTVDADGEPAPDGEQAATGDKPQVDIAVEPPADLGRSDRILFKNGGSLVCFILSKRTDADGVLQSVRVVHLDDGGEEILAADLIARIEEDIR